MKLNRKFTVIALLAIAGASGAAATSSPKPDEYKDLKVLPKHISSKELQGIMVDDFQDALGVTCGFCHANAADGIGLDFASNEKPEKLISRKMMRMTIDINKKYFKLKNAAIGSTALVVTCATCHKGTPFPDGSAAQ